MAEQVEVFFSILARRVRMRGEFASVEDRVARVRGCVADDVGSASAVRGACEGRAACLEYALANDERFGVWGGLSESERLALRQRR